MTELVLVVLLTITLGACTAAEAAAGGPTEGPRIRVELLAEPLRWLPGLFGSMGRAARRGSRREARWSAARRTRCR
jgi:hypothetical protein